LRSGNAANLMETDESGSGNSVLESEYLTLFGKSLAHCVEDLLVISYMLGGSKENGPSTAPKQTRVAIEQSGLDSKVSYTSIISSRLESPIYENSHVLCFVGRWLSIIDKGR
jgi:hypothetical protein